MNTKDFFNIFNERTQHSIIDDIVSCQKTAKFSNNDLMKRRAVLSHLSIIDSMYRFIIPLIIQNVLTNRSDVDGLSIKSLANIKDSAAMRSIWEFDYDIKNPMYINMDTGYKIYDVITKHKRVNNVLNFGTGWGSSNIYASLALMKKSRGSITTVEHLSAFTDISKYIYDIALGFGIPLTDNIDYLNCDLIKFADHKCFNSFKRFCNSKKYRRLLTGRKERMPKLTYDFNTKNKFDLIIVDGPPVFRIPTFLLGVHLVRDDGYIMFENCRKEVPFLKNLGIRFKQEYGKVMKKKYKKHKIYAASILKVTKAIKKKFINV